MECYHRHVHGPSCKRYVVSGWFLIEGWRWGFRKGTLLHLGIWYAILKFAFPHYHPTNYHYPPRSPNFVAEGFEVSSQQTVLYEG